MLLLQRVFAVWAGGARTAHVSPEEARLTSPRRRHRGRRRWGRSARDTHQEDRDPGHHKENPRPCHHQLLSDREPCEESPDPTPVVKKWTVTHREPLVQHGVGVLKRHSA